MTMVLLPLLGLVMTPGAPPVDAANLQRREQQEASRAVRMGRILPEREIVGRILPTMRGSQYLGLDFDPEGGIYTLKFLRDGTVIWIQVDGRTGQVVGRTSY